MVADLGDTWLEVEYALLKHAEFLETHRHVIEGDKRDVFVTRAAVQAHYLEDTLCLL